MCRVGFLSSLRIAIDSADVAPLMCVQKTVEVIQLVPQERIQERIAEQVVDVPLPQIIEEMLFSSIRVRIVQ